MAAKKTRSQHKSLNRDRICSCKFLLEIAVLACAQDQAESERQTAAKEARRKQVQADERCATLEGQLATRKEQVAQLRSDLQVHRLSLPS